MSIAHPGIDLTPARDYNIIRGLFSRCNLHQHLLVSPGAKELRLDKYGFELFIYNDRNGCWCAWGRTNRHFAHRRNTDPNKSMHAVVSEMLGILQGGTDGKA